MQKRKEKTSLAKVNEDGRSVWLAFFAAKELAAQMQ